MRSQVCEGAASSDDVQEVIGELLAYTSDAEVESEEIESITEEIENELEEAITDMIAENKETSTAGEYWEGYCIKALEFKSCLTFMQRKKLY